MKFNGLVATAALLLTGLSSAQAESISCKQPSNRADGYAISVSINGSELVISQSSRVARYAQIRETVQRMTTTEGLDASTADYYCSDLLTGVEVVVKGNVVQVNSGTRPVTYAIVKPGEGSLIESRGSMCAELLAAGIVTPECSLPK